MEVLVLNLPYVECWQFDLLEGNENQSWGVLEQFIRYEYRWDDPPWFLHNKCKVRKKHVKEGEKILIFHG